MAWQADGTCTHQELPRCCLAPLIETTPPSAVEAGRRCSEMPEVVPLAEFKKRDSR